VSSSFIYFERCVDYFVSLAFLKKNAEPFKIHDFTAIFTSFSKCFSSPTPLHQIAFHNPISPALQALVVVEVFALALASSLLLFALASSFLLLALASALPLSTLAVTHPKSCGLFPSHHSTACCILSPYLPPSSGLVHPSFGNHSFPARHECKHSAVCAAAGRLSFEFWNMRT